MGRVLVLAAVVMLCVAAPASAGVVEVSDLSGGGFLTYSDPAGLPDNLRIVSSEERVVLVLGPTVTAGSGCVAVEGGASCTRPPSTVAWERSSIATEGGDDVVVVEAPQPMRIFGGAGNDQVTFAAGTAGGLYGMEGDDVLTAAGAARLEGGEGNDRLSAGAASGLSGGPGTDRLDGSPQNDVLVDAGDAGTRDVIACNGGTDVTQSDKGDVSEGCTRGALDEISKVKYRWRAYFATGLSVPLRLRVRNTDYAGVQSPFARCLGAACRGARLDAPGRDLREFKIVSGGVRFKVDGRTRRGVRPGALVRIGLQFTFGDVMFTKGLEFRTRAGKLPTNRKRCTVTVPPLGGRTRVVPCT